jgi:hypothetical protein
VTKKMKVTIVVAVVLCVALAIVVLATQLGWGRGGGGGDGDGGDAADGGETQESVPDLTVSAIEVYPAQPQSGQRFSLSIYVANEGNAPSGEYDLAINIEDISHGGYYPIGTFRQEAMSPGEDYCVYSSTDRLVNSPGSYQVNVEIEPFLFEDGNPSNNSWSKPFSAN